MNEATVATTFVIDRLTTTIQVKCGFAKGKTHAVSIMFDTEAHQILSIQAPCAGRWTQAIDISDTTAILGGHTATCAELAKLIKSYPQGTYRGTLWGSNKVVTNLLEACRQSAQNTRNERATRNTYEDETHWGDGSLRQRMYKAVLTRQCDKKQVEARYVEADTEEHDRECVQVYWINPTTLSRYNTDQCWLTALIKNDGKWQPVTNRRLLSGLFIANRASIDTFSGERVPRQRVSVFYRSKKRCELVEDFLWGLADVLNREAKRIVLPTQLKAVRIKTEEGKLR